jgi:uncharacterized membrane protein YhaH (DUF805 family)
VSFGQAIRSVLSKYATFRGRARRSEFWWWVLFVTVVNLLAVMVDQRLGLRVLPNSRVQYGWVTLVVWLALLVPDVAVTVRRLHDTGRSGWWWLLSLLYCVGGLVVLAFCSRDSEAGTNRFGPEPKIAGERRSASTS